MNICIAIKMRISLALPLSLLLVGAASAQTTQPAPSNPTLEEIDACGVLVSRGGCVLFEGGGGAYVLSNYGGFRAGDSVRVTGFINDNCVTICGEADGCVSAAEVYDPAILPCGEPIRAIEDLPGELCSLAAGALTAGTAAGLAFTRGRRRT